MSAPSIKLVHTSLRYTLLKQARINFEQTPKPANLHYLADHASSEELQELYQWNPGDVAIFALERNNARMLRNVRECAYGTMHQRISFIPTRVDCDSLSAPWGIPKLAKV